MYGMPARMIPALLMCLAVLTLPCPAEEWALIGARSLGMGGTGVASASGSEAYYWNPALYAKDTQYDMSFPLGFGIAIEGEMLEKADYLADRLEQIDFEALQDKFNAADTDPTSIDDDDFRDAFEVLMADIPALSEKGTGVVAHGSIGLVTRFGNYGVSALGIAYAGGHPVIDLTVAGGIALSDDAMTAALSLSNVTYMDHTADLNGLEQTIAANIQAKHTLSVDTATTFVWLAKTSNGVDLTNPITQKIFYAIADATFENDSGTGSNEVMLNNLSGVDVGIIFTREVGCTVSRHFMDHKLAVGTNIKGIIADTFTSSVIVSDLEEGETVEDEATEFKLNEVSAYRIGFDAGILYSPISSVNLGLTVRNLNQPTFRFKGEDDAFKLKSQTRAGVQWKPFESFSLAADIDVVPNSSEVIDDLDVQFLAAGVEWTPIRWFALRGGMYKNIAASESPVYTLGLGFHMSKFYLDLAGSLGFSEVKVESDLSGDEIYLPERGTFILSMGFDFRF